MKDIERFKQLINDLSVKYEERYRDGKSGIDYPITDVNLLTIKSNLLENEWAYGVGLEIVFDKEGRFIGFEPYGDQ